ESMSFSDFINQVECDYETKRLPLSGLFWPTYEKIKEHKENIRSNKSDLAIEKRAHDNLKVALRIIDPSEEENMDFIKTLIKDIKNYYTMPKYTLRRLGFERLTPKSGKHQWQKFWDELDAIKQEFGVDYLVKMLERVKDLKEE